jgi:uncharacterized protein YbjT (DUF2867 family)
MADKVAVAGATGYVGGALTKRLLAEGKEVVALARKPEKASELADAGAEVREGDVLDRDSLKDALEGAEVAYYLVHSMGRGSEDADFAKRDQQGAENFAAAAAEAGVSRIVYLGGMTGESVHLASRDDTGRALQEGDVPVVYFRAAAVIGAGSESFRLVYFLVKRLPAMVTPSWTKTRTQPIGIDDVTAFLAQAADAGPEAEREIEIGGPDVTTYGGMMDELAEVMEVRRRPRIPVPVLTPQLSSHWIGLVTPVDTGVAKPLIEGLRSETIVRDPSGMELFDVETTPLRDAMRAALEEGIES